MKTKHRMARRVKHQTRHVAKEHLDDIIRASHRGSREAEFALLGPGFHPATKVHKSKKVYSRKDKHKNQDKE